MSKTVKSADGTSIAFSTYGEGTPIIIVAGATAYRATQALDAQIGEIMQDEFKVYSYDRRGRGESGDTAPYAVEREIEDLAALIEDAGGSAILAGISSGGVLALHAAQAGLPVTKLALFEPPFVVDDGRPARSDDYVEKLDAFVAEGRRDAAVELFMTDAVNLPAEYLDGMKQSPFWPGLEQIAHTIAYDGRIMGMTMRGDALPADAWSSVDVPVLVMYGNGTEPWLQAGSRALAELLPTATLQPVDGAQHDVAADVWSAAVREFAAK